MKRVAFHTLGCKVNQYDTDAIAAKFKAHGYQLTEFDDPSADVYVINTCTVTNTSDRKSRQMIRRAHKTNERAKIVVVGCFAQTSPEQASAISGVSLVVGTEDRGRIVDLLDTLDSEKPHSVVENLGPTMEFEELPVVEFEGKTRGFLKIQDGCNQFCSYCKVPYARGLSRSRTKQNVLEQVRQITDQRYPEIVLTGVHLGGYGRDLNPEYSLSRIIHDITELDGVTRVRIGSVDPNEIDSRLLDLVANNPKVCRHLHIPLQSGSDIILTQMRRKYLTRDFQAVVDRIRNQVATVGLTTDVIVGFPGETEQLFSETYDFIRNIGFSRLHVFKYSPRAGTKAASFTGQVSSEEKDQRSAALLKLSDMMADTFHQQFMGKTVDVLVEQADQECAVGLTGEYVRVSIPTNLKSSPEWVGDIISVKINQTDCSGIAGIPN